jgi:hypothetical protein
VCRWRSYLHFHGKNQTSDEAFSQIDWVDTIKPSDPSRPPVTMFLFLHVVDSKIHRHKGKLAKQIRHVGQTIDYCRCNLFCFRQDSSGLEICPLATFQMHCRECKTRVTKTEYQMKEKHCSKNQLPHFTMSSLP